MWYQNLLQPILDAKTDTLFAVDKANLIDIPPIKACLSETYSAIVHYENELKLRILLRNKEQRAVIVFQNENDIPFDLLSTYPVVTLDIIQVFPLFDREALLRIPYDDYPFIYQQYQTLTQDRYEKLSHVETEQLVTPLLNSDEYTIQKRILELRTRLDALKKRLPKTHTTFGEISNVLGELLFIEHDHDVNLHLDQERRTLQAEFAQFVGHYYEDSIFDHTLRMHARLLEHIFENSSGQKIAFICFDCMGFEEWNIIKEYLESRGNFQFEVNYSFAMLPSETHYSRTTLFAGCFPKEIKARSLLHKLRAGNEKQLFYDALQNRFGIEEHDIYFHRCLKPVRFPIEFEALGDYFAIGTIFSFIDQLTHNKLMNKNMLINNIRTHLADSRLDEFVMSLLNHDFRVYLTSDHGSIYAYGNDVKVPKDLTDERAKRYIIFSQKIIAEEYLAKTEHALLLQLKNMIGEEFLLVLTDDSMFAGDGQFELTHGGISLEEVVVPFIEVKAYDRI